MGKSIRSKKKRALRTLKREKLDGVEAKQIEARYIKLQISLGKQKEEAEASFKKSVEPAAEDEAAVDMDFQEDDYAQFGKPPKTRRSKMNETIVRKKATKKKGTKAFLAFATGRTKRKKWQKGTVFGSS